MKLLGVLIGCAVLGAVSTGCASQPRKVVLHPIEKEDIFYIEKGVRCGSTITKKDGYFISKDYMKEVMDVGIEEL